MRILCFPYTHTLSHISRLLAVGKVLRSRGHELIFGGAGAGTKSHFIEQEGFKTLPCFQIDPDKLFNRIRDGKIRFIEDEELEMMVESDRALYQEVKPDLVFADGRFSSPISAGIEKIPHAAIVNVSSTEYRALPYVPFFEWLPTSLARKFDSFNLWLEMKIFDNVASAFKQWSKEYQLQKTVTATNCLTGNELTLMADLPEYFPTRTLPDNYQYIGPLTWHNGTSLPEWWPPETAGRKLVYISMGTTWVGGRFEDLYALLRRHNLAAIITTGGQLPESEQGLLQTVPGEIYLEEFIPGEEVMKICDLVVCHGGNGTIYQALEYGRPIVGIPTIPDQDFNMRRVEALGVGLKITPKSFEKDPECLVTAINRILDTPSFQQKASEFQDKLSGLEPATRAADLIESRFNS